jgi:hypothetical protein
MGFNKRYVNYKNTLNALNNGGLKEYYGKSDALIFEDSKSSYVYELFMGKKTEEEILLTIKNMEEKTNEMY